MNISIILCTWNNSKRLDITLSSFVCLETPSAVTWELVVVNNNSTDSTQTTVLKYTNKLPIKYVVEPSQGLSHARNAGLFNATGDLVIFTDDDVKPCKEWLNIYWQAYQENPNGYFFGGAIESEFEDPPDDLGLIRLAPCSVRGLDWGPTPKLLAIGEFFVSANWGCPSNILKKVGGFNVSLGLNPSSGKVLVGEETEMMDRLLESGFKPYYLPSAKLLHFVPKSKMTLEHIGARTEALGRTLAKSEDLQSGKIWFGAPRWMWLRSLILLKNYCLLRVKGKNGYEEYLAYRRLRGNILGLREKVKIDN